MTIKGCPRTAPRMKYRKIIRAPCAPGASIMSARLVIVEAHVIVLVSRADKFWNTSFEKRFTALALATALSDDER